MNATLFIHPAIASTAPDPRAIPWTLGADVRAVAAYIRAWLREQHGHR